jgi:hypothetical protein
MGFEASKVCARVRDDRSFCASFECENRLRTLICVQPACNEYIKPERTKGLGALESSVTIIVELENVLM